MGLGWFSGQTPGVQQHPDARQTDHKTDGQDEIGKNSSHGEVN